jgi:putative ABC transport system permease protein
MTLWLVLQGIRRAPRRLLLASLGVAFPVAVMAAGLLFLNIAIESMTATSLAPLKLEQRALATTLDADMTAIGKRLATVPGVSRVDRFAAADVVLSTPGQRTGATARLFAIDPSYIKHNPWVRVVQGRLGGGHALLDQALRATPGFASAKDVSIQLAGTTGNRSLTLPATGTVDLRDTLPAWFAIPVGDVQGDQALVPRSIVIDYATFERRLLPAIKRQLGTATPVLNPGLTDLPPVSVEAHVRIDHRAFPQDPGQAATWSRGLQHLLERRATGEIAVADAAYEPLVEAASDATNAITLFFLLGLPGVLVAAALGLGAQSALADAHRREDALLRLRGATDGQLAWLAAVPAALAWVIGSVVGLVVAAGAVTAVTGSLVWDGVPAGRLGLAIGLAVAAGALTTLVRLVSLVRAGRRPEVVERRRMQQGWQPLWRRAWLDITSIGVGLAVLGISAAGGGLKQTPLDPSQGSTLTLRFYVLLGLVFLWLGVTLLAVRGLLACAARRSRPGAAGSLTSWRAAPLRWFGRRPARTGVAIVLGALAMGFGVQVVTFVATYRAAKQAETDAAFGSDLRLTPGNPSVDLPGLPRRQIAALSPVRMVPARAQSDRKMIMAIDPRSYGDTMTRAPRIVLGRGVDALARDPGTVLIAPEIQKDFAIQPGDTIPITLFPDDKDQSRNIKLRVAGIYRSVPPGEPPAEFVVNVAALPPYLVGQPDFYLARTPPGTSAKAVADDLRGGILKGRFAVSTTETQVRTAQRSLTALNLGPLATIEGVAAGLIAAVGVAVLGAFIVLERRREFAILQAVGADAAQVRAGPRQEGMLAVAASVAIGLPIGLALGLCSVRVLGLFFALPPPLLSVPVLTIAGFVLLMTVACAAVLGAALVAITRVNAAVSLRET